MGWRGIVLAVALGVLSRPDTAQACGGCFGPPGTLSTVTAHRMAFAISEERTVLWDQFAYDGSPEEFSWVLPVAPGAYLEASTQAWFDALEAMTATRVVPPPLNCASGSGSGCGSMQAQSIAASADRGSVGGPSVQVIDRRTVGPYETVTLRSTEGDALVSWLDDNDYVVPIDIEPVIEAYVEEGADFIALKLQPGVGVQQMTPVRVVTPSGDAILPLRMVAAGVADQVDIVLYVIGEGRYTLPDLVEVSLDEAELEFDFETNDSNYLRVRSSVLSENGGFSVLASYAQRGAFFETFNNGVVTTNGVFTQNFWQLYFGQAAEIDQRQNTCSFQPRAGLETSEIIVDNPESAMAPNSGLFICNGYTDWAAAMIGQRPSNTWLTRLEMTLPRTALSMDCVVEKAESQRELSNLLNAQKSKNRPDSCEQPVFSSSIARSRVEPGMVACSGLVLLILVGLRRRRARIRKTV